MAQATVWARWGDGCPTLRSMRRRAKACQRNWKPSPNRTNWSVCPPSRPCIAHGSIDLVICYTGKVIFFKKLMKTQIDEYNKWQGKLDLHTLLNPHLQRFHRVQLILFKMPCYRTKSLPNYRLTAVQIMLIDLSFPVLLWWFLFSSSISRISQLSLRRCSYS